MRAARFMTLPRYVMRPVVLCTRARNSPQSRPHFKRRPLRARCHVRASGRWGETTQPHAHACSMHHRMHDCMS